MKSFNKKINRKGRKKPIRYNKPPAAITPGRTGQTQITQAPTHTALTTLSPHPA